MGGTATTSAFEIPELPIARRLRYRLEAGVGIGILEACSRVPQSMATNLGYSLGSMAWALDFRRRRVTLDNLALAVGDETTEEERRTIGRNYYRNLGRNALESAILTRRHPQPPVGEFVHFDDPAAVDRQRESGPAIYVGAHSGSWELMMAGGKERVGSTATVVRPMSNPYLNRRVLRFRDKLGVMMIPQTDRAAAGIVRAVKRGHSIGLLADLNERHQPLFIDFFGRPAATVRGPGVIATRLNVPVVPVFSYHKDEPFQFGIRQGTPLLPLENLSAEENAIRVMVKVTAFLEKCIREFMDQWAWNYRRWKTQPGPEDVVYRDADFPD